MQPRRLLDDDAHPAARALLCAGRDDAPPAGARARAMAALGIAAATSTLGASAGAASIAGSKISASLPLVSILKWAGGGLVVGAAVVTAAVTAVPSTTTPTERGRAETEQPLVTEPATQPASTAGPPAMPIVSQPSAAASVSKPQRFMPSSSPVNRDPQHAPPPSVEPQASHSDLLRAEVALIDGARRALHRGDSNAALALLNRHRQEHPSGVLLPEAFVLRLEALVRAGQGDVARTRARGYLEKNPNGAHAARIRKIIGQ